MIMRKKLIAILFCGAFLLLNVSSGQKSLRPNPPDSASVEDWEKEFDDLCSKTQDAMSYSISELKTMIQRCDALQPQIEKLDETRKKVFSRRLAQCRGLYAYVLESKQNEKK